MSTIRIFKIAGSDIEYSGGRYKSNKTGAPGSAARKAAKVLLRMVENKKSNPEWKKYEKFGDHKTIKFFLEEITRGSERKSYYYEASEKSLSTPETRVINGVEIVYTKKVVVKSCSGGNGN